MKRTLHWLALAVIGSALGAWILAGGEAALAAGYGAAIALVNALLLALRAWQARRLGPPEELAPQGAEEILIRAVPMRLVLFSTLERLLAVALLLALGLTVLALMPPMLMIGFVVGQVVLVLAGATTKLEPHSNYGTK